MKIKFCIIALFFSTFITAPLIAEELNVGEKIDYYETGEILAKHNIVQIELNEVIEGNTKRFYENGTLALEAEISNGKFASLRYYNEIGQLIYSFLNNNSTYHHLAYDPESGKLLSDVLLDDQSVVTKVYFPQKIDPINSYYASYTTPIDMANGMAYESPTQLIKIDDARISAQEALAQSVLRTLSTASETFAISNNGNYPKNMSALTNAKPPYIYQNYCGYSDAGYGYTCEMSTDGYKFTATPTSIEKTGSNVYTITTGGVLMP